MPLHSGSRTRMGLLSLAGWLILLTAVMSSVAKPDEMPIPTLTRYVTDQTGTLTEEQMAGLEATLADFDRQTSTQLVVLMVPTLGTGVLEDVSLKVAEKNGIGRKGKDNGALLFIAKNDRRVRVEVGYGLEGALPDALAGQIIRHEIGPRFRNGDYFGGISAAIQAIMQATKGEYRAEEQDRPSRHDLSPLVFFIIMLFLVVRVFSRFGRRRWGGGIGPFFMGGWGGFPSSGVGGGGFGGGGFSGGGGSFGGGGASGGW